MEYRKRKIKREGSQLHEDIVQLKMKASDGKFRIIGKVLEAIPEGENILLNRENAVELYNPNTFKDVKKAFNSIKNINFKEFKDVVKGKTIVIMPIAIAI